VIKPLCCALTLALMFPVVADAQVRLSGFGQVMAGTTLDDNPIPLLGYDDEIDFKPESLFAVQISADLAEQWSATAQVVARGREDFEPEFAWAYLNWKSGNWSAKLGRQRIPFYRYSDFLEVGYGYAWARPPRTVYGGTGFDNFDGINLNYSRFDGELYSSFQAIYGGTDVTVVRPQVTFDQSLNRLFGVTWDGSYAGWLNMRAAYITAKADIDSPLLNPLLAALSGNGFGNVAASIDVVEDNGYFWGVGADIDRGNWVVGFETIGRGIDDSLAPDTRESYVSAAYRLGVWQPYVVYGWSKADPDFALAEPLRRAPPLFNATQGALQRQQVDETYASLGIRWDVASNVALKADYTRYNTKVTGQNDGDALVLGAVFSF
jgi:hypothetical protein